MQNRPMLTQQDIMIKAYEIDSVGIVSNIVYIKWFEDLRHVFLAKYYPYREMMQSGISPMLVKTEADYKAPLTITDMPTVRSWVSKMGKVKWEITIEVFSGDTVYCVGRQLGCFYDINNQCVTHIPERLKGAYEQEISEGI
jgi:acyl-CoA thioester hydrolase